MFLFYTVSIQGKKHISSDADKLSAAAIDEGLFPRIAGGDREALETLYLSTEKSVYALILSIVKNPHDAQDIMQDTYLKIRAGAHLYRPQGKPLAWIFTIAKNLSLMHLRRKQHFAEVSSDELENSSNLAVVMDADDRLVLATLLNRLGEEERQIVLLHAVSGMKHREMASALGIPLSTVLSKYTRALKKLKKYLSDEEGTHE